MSGRSCRSEPGPFVIGGHHESFLRTVWAESDFCLFLIIYESIAKRRNYTTSPGRFLSCIKSPHNHRCPIIARKLLDSSRSSRSQCSFAKRLGASCRMCDDNMYNICVSMCVIWHKGIQAFPPDPPQTWRVFAG